jgi:HEPN/RES N-terminal domain 1/RES domain
VAIDRVCSSCFGDDDLRTWIRKANESRGCDACGKFDSPTRELIDICRHIEDCLRKYWGFAVEQLPFESAEGGYQGTTWDTYDLLLDEVCLHLPRDKNGALFSALIQGLTDETWCEYDWLSLEIDVALRISWQRFCETVKHERRFFFHSVGTDDIDSYTPTSLLATIARISQHMGLINELPSLTRLWRARPDLSRGCRAGASDFGPPPVQFALQSNRMNPPGIPMFYLASTAQTALAETRAREARVGQWEVTRPVRILDLRRLPEIPGYFSDVERQNRLALRFLHHFAEDIMTPVARDKRVHIDYLPSQVVTEFMRDYDFDGGKIDGIAYRSTLREKGWNIALFLGPQDLGFAAPKRWRAATLAPALRFLRSVRVTAH